MTWKPLSWLCLLTLMLADGVGAVPNAPTERDRPRCQKNPAESAAWHTDAARRLTLEERRLPPAIQRLLIAYTDHLDTAYMQGDHLRDRGDALTHHPSAVVARETQRPEVLEGTLIWCDKTRSTWRAADLEISLDEWMSATPQQRQAWWSRGSFEETLNRPTLGDQLLQRYPVDRALPKRLPQNFEPGRVRVEWFFKQMYGETRRDVGAHLTTIRWGKQHLRVTDINGIDEKLKSIYRELTQLERRFTPFYHKSAGAFVWRKIKGTSRISVHSFGAAIDLGVQRSNYWKWTLKVLGADAEGLIPYQNRFPAEVVKIFERYGWVWGGWWYHHDTMHFEYRPELLVKLP